MTGVHNNLLGFQLRKLILGKLEHEIAGKSFCISPDLFIQSLRFNAIKDREVGGENYPLVANGQNQGFDRRFAFHDETQPANAGRLCLFFFAPCI
jgi:hypothetical protein